MAKWLIYDYINERGDNEIAAWTRKLQKPQRIKLRAKLNMLAENGPDLPGLLLKTEVEYIYKIKV
jgi:mRNA-degrading endonuclease RelE of RelBE toxin-antitoxin system